MSGVTSRRGLVGLVLALAMVVTACGAKPVPTKAPVINGGTLTLGVWQDPGSFLDAGITGTTEFGTAIDSVAAEGLLWYTPTSATADDTFSNSSPADNWTPDLATTVPTVENGLVKTTGCALPGAGMCVTWNLRTGVKWQDGSTFSSTDVCDTFGLHWLWYGNNNPTPGVITTGWNDVMGCDDTNPNVAVVSFKTAYGPYLTLGSGADGIMPAALLKSAYTASTSLLKTTTSVNLTVGSGSGQAFNGSTTLDQVIDGTGPYVLSSYTPGQSYVFVKNPNYWNTAQIPHINKVVFDIEPDQESEVSAMEAGDIQAGFDMGLPDLSALKQQASNDGFTVAPVADPGAEFLMFNVCGEKAYWVGGASLCGPGKYSEYTADPIIRQAIRDALDRSQIINQLAPGATTVPPDSWMSLGATWIAAPASVSTTPFNDDTANALLDNAGYKLSINCDGGKFRAYSDGSCIIIRLGTTSDDSARTATEALVAADLANVGIEVEPAFQPNVTTPEFFAPLSQNGPLVTHNFDMVMYSASLSAPADPDTWLPFYYGCQDTTQALCARDPNASIPSVANGGVGGNFSGINDQQLDNDLVDAHNDATVESLQGYYIDAEKVLAEEVPNIPLYQELTINGYSNVLHKLQTNAFDWDFNIAQWYCYNGTC